MRLQKEPLTYGDPGSGPTMTISSEIVQTAIKDQPENHSRLYTGEYESITVSVQNTTESTGDRARVYVQMEPGGTINYAGGTYELEDSNTHHKYQLHITKDENNRYCLEFESLQHGDTVAFNFSCSYPSPKTAGGSARIWGEILKNDETTEQPPTKIQKVTWETKADDLEVKEILR